MKHFRTILIGVIIFGAFGAKLAAFLTLAGVLTQSSWYSIEIGFLLGALIGGAGAATFSISTSRVAKKSKASKQRDPQISSARLATKTM